MSERHGSEKTIYNWIEEATGIQRPITGYDGNQCLAILKHKKIWLQALQPHPLFGALHQTWNALHDILHYSVRPDASEHLEPLRGAITQYCNALNDYFAGQELHVKGHMANKFMRAYYMHAQAIVRRQQQQQQQQQPVLPPHQEHQQEANEAYLQMQLQLFTAYPALEYTYKVYDHFTACHLALQVEENGNLLCGSSWFVEAGNAAWKSALRQHTSRKGGRTEEARNIYVQGLRRLWNRTHPSLHAWRRVPVKRVPICKICGLSGTNHICARREDEEDA